MLLFLYEPAEKKGYCSYMNQQLYWQVIFKVFLEHEMEVTLPIKISSLSKDNMSAWKKVSFL